METFTPDRISIDNKVLEEARAADEVNLTDAQLVLKFPDGSEQPLASSIQKLLASALHSLAKNGSVSIGQIPEELTSTTAADLLSVSRPTLMKWVEAGEISSHKVGTHTRFKRQDVLALKMQREQDRREAFAELRALDAELDEIDNS
ncbi:helix-turn-helix domain-containing protein [Enteractinococcus helveticum]|uniref:Helix-turn-helix domain-containing protein n=1 Tax=Enteractinococcus helveticum TaxID=1837282 RepID=A0A1B7M0M5_9MICC|nr:helix-turn-helix domain-containing protein [Enteractinococcus helveticum]OAV61806.1 hypothetical protein A6F49_07885 [Enteractinococcus helveticum]